MKSEAAISDLGLSYKLVLVGDSGVGKTNLASRYVFNKFSFENNSTIGVEYFSKNIIFDDIKIKIHIWDSAGQERFRSITKCYYRGAKGAFVVFDITKPESFENTEKWIEELLNTGDKDLIVYVLGNKIDLDMHRKTSFEQAKFKIEQRNLKYFETSAENSHNVNLAFDSLIKEIYDNNKGEILSLKSAMKNMRSINPKKIRKLDKDDKNGFLCCL